MGGRVDGGTVSVGTGDGGKEGLVGTEKVQKVEELGEGDGLLPVAYVLRNDRGCGARPVKCVIDEGEVAGELDLADDLVVGGT